MDYDASASPQTNIFHSKALSMGHCRGLGSSELIELRVEVSTNLFGLNAWSLGVDVITDIDEQADMCIK